MNENSTENNDNNDDQKSKIDAETPKISDIKADTPPLLTEHVISEQENVPSVPPAVPQQPVPPKNNAVEIVWQWLSYVLWEWALIALSIMLSTTLAYYVSQTDTETAVTYSLATMICLLPLAYVADWLYRKKEPAQKHGFAAFVLVLNALLVFLAAIGSLIAAVVAGLSILTSVTASSGMLVFVLSSLVVSVLAGLLFVRILHPQKLNNFTKLFPLIVVAVAVVGTVLAVAGPFKSQIVMKQDRLVEENLPALSASVRTYFTQHNTLPENLQALEDSNPEDISKQTMQALTNHDLVTYQVVQNGKSQGVTIQTYPPQAKTITPTNSYVYKLCANYRHAKGSGQTPLGNTETYIDTSSHASGQVCYTQTAE